MLPRSFDFGTAISIHALVKRATEYIQFIHVPETISIHALVKRATCGNASIHVDAAHISIHALVKRATGLADSSNGSKGDFNPRPREEGDRLHRVGIPCRPYFNPRPREEGD